MCSLFFSYYLSRWLQRPLILGKPMHISVEPTTACNLRCPECPSGLRSFHRPTGNIQAPVFTRIIDEMHRDLMTLILYFQGEPMIHPGFFEMVKYAKLNNIYTITSTNGHFLNKKSIQALIDSGLDRLIISIDGTTQDTYEQYRKEGNLAQVLEGTKLLVAAKKQQKAKYPHIIIQFLVVKPNEHQIPEIQKIASELGVDELRLKTAQVYDYEHGNAFIPDQEEYSRYVQKKDGTWKLKSSAENHCWRMWQGCVFTWDGKVVPCCFDKDASHVMGNITQQPFNTIWQSPSYQQFRQHLFHGRSQIDICTNCSEGVHVFR